MTRRKRSRRPEKPRPDYPLSAHPSGQWCKRIHSKLYYFGPWDDPEGALIEYERRRPLIVGERLDSQGVTVKQLINRMLHTKKLLVEAGELRQRTWDDYRDVGKRLKTHFGASRPIATLSPQDFENLRKSCPASWSATTMNNFIIRTKAFLNYAYEHELVNTPIRTGVAFKRASQKKVRIQRAQRPAKFFDADEIKTLLDNASRHMKAMILCGVNLGYGNADCSRLTKSMISDGWVVEPREKTGVLRMGKLWPETEQAIADVLRYRPAAPSHLEDHVFITRTGNTYWNDGGHDAIATQFYRLTQKCNLRRTGTGFYALRHVTQTIGDQLGDHLAVMVLMGHIDSSISDKYREHFDRHRVEKVCDHIRSWYLEKQKKEKR